MARIRTIKPEFWRSNKIASLSEFSRLFAIAILNVADDDGYFIADPRLIRGEVFPFEDDYGRCTVAIRELSDQGYLEVRDDGNGTSIGKIVKFAEHQVINKKKPSKIRGMFDKLAVPDEYCTATVLVPSGREQGAGNREQGEGRESPPVPIFKDSQEFQELWKRRLKKYFETQGQQLPQIQADAELMELSRRGKDAAIKDLENTILKGYGRTICEHDKFKSSQQTEPVYEKLTPRVRTKTA